MLARVVWRYQSKIMAVGEFLFSSPATSNANYRYCEKKMIYCSVHSGRMFGIRANYMNSIAVSECQRYFLLLILKL